MVCVQCRKQMRCKQNGSGVLFGRAQVYPGDKFQCGKCGTEVILTNQISIFDPEHKAQEEYLQMEQLEEE